MSSSSRYRLGGISGRVVHVVLIIRLGSDVVGWPPASDGGLVRLVVSRDDLVVSGGGGVLVTASSKPA